MTDVLAIVARVLLYTGVTLGIGQLASMWACGASSRDALDRPQAIRWTPWVALLIALALMLSAQMLALELHVSRADLSMLLRETGWGRGWTFLAISSVAFALSALLSAPFALRVLLAVCVAIAMSGLGHAAADSLPLLARALDSVHVLGVGAWIGALLLLASESRPAVWRRFSALATIASIAVVFTGVGAAFRRLGPSLLSASSLTAAGLREIAKSEYVQLLALKVMLVVVVLSFGLVHRRAVGAQQAPSKRSVQLELVFAAIVLATTAWLTGTAPPGE